MRDLDGFFREFMKDEVMSDGFGCVGLFSGFFHKYLWVIFMYWVRE